MAEGRSFVKCLALWYYMWKALMVKSSFVESVEVEKLDPWMIAQLLFSGKSVSPSQLLLATSLSLTFFQESVWDERNFQISMVHSISFKIGVLCFILVLEYSNCPAPKKKYFWSFSHKDLLLFGQTCLTFSICYFLRQLQFGKGSTHFVDLSMKTNALGKLLVFKYLN